MRWLPLTPHEAIKTENTTMAYFSLYQIYINLYKLLSNNISLAILNDEYNC